MDPSAIAGSKSGAGCARKQSSTASQTACRAPSARVRNGPPTNSAVEQLADQLYTMELEGKSERSRWPYRKAAWAIEDTQQDIGLIYKTMGLQGLKNIKDVGPKMCGILEKVILAENNPE